VPVVLPVATVTSATQELHSKFTQFQIGQSYQGMVAAKISDTEYVVNVSGKGLDSGIEVSMALGEQAKLGQTLALSYFKAQPIPTFILKEPEVAHAPIPGSQVQLSQTGQLLGQYLHHAEAQHAPQYVVASQIVSFFPTKPQLLAQDLKHALSTTGLFYESHMQALSQGQVSISDIRQEPQNQQGFNPTTMLYQQLNTLEQQRISWQGEVWPGQAMQWQVYQQALVDERSAEHEGLLQAPQATVSELTVDLPHLGKVSAKITMLDGHVRLQLTAEHAGTLQKMQHEKHRLSDALTQHGQVIDTLAILLQSKHHD
jgi:hypothetical protein